MRYTFQQVGSFIRMQAYKLLGKQENLSPN